MQYPAGYLLTWTTYAAWLHGDDRGSVDSRHNQHGTDTLRPHEAIRAARARALTHEPLTLTVEARSVVEQAIQRHATRRGWELLAVSARTNHVHAVVQRPSVKPELMLRQLKDWATRDLRRLGLVARGRPIWAQHGSTRWLWNEPSLLNAARYVRERQDGDDYWLAQSRLRSLELARSRRRVDDEPVDRVQ